MNMALSSQRNRRRTAKDLAAVGHAVRYLAQARWIHGRQTVAQLLSLARDTGQLSGRNEELARCVSVAISRAAPRVPWRSDCFIRALAAQAWLAKHGVGSELFIGVRKDHKGFSAHAWLRHEDLTVTGGDFSSYQPIVSPETSLPIQTPDT